VRRDADGDERLALGVDARETPRNTSLAGMPNLAASWPVAMWACVSMLTLGLMRRPMRAPAPERPSARRDARDLLAHSRPGIEKMSRPNGGIELGVGLGDAAHHDAPGRRDASGEHERELTRRTRRRRRAPRRTACAGTGPAEFALTA
jgi:hypothetical protein